MIGLIQRTGSASVTVGGQRIAAIGRGMLVLVGFVRDDDPDRVDRFIERLLNYRIFPDSHGRMNLSLRQIEGGLLLVPQFTLAADTGRGNRPSFTPAAPPERGQALFEELVARAEACWPHFGCGQFGAEMQVALVNDGPVTFWLEVN